MHSRLGWRLGDTWLNSGGGVWGLGLGAVDRGARYVCETYLGGCFLGEGRCSCVVSVAREEMQSGWWAEAVCRW